jgi:multiple sugar transport system substrate-binding protein
MVKPLSRRDFLKMSALAAGGLLVACQPAEKEEPAAKDEPAAKEEPTQKAEPTPTPEPEEVTIQLMFWPVGGERGIKSMDLALEPFRERTPNIVVETLPTPWGELHDKFLTMSAGGAPPDVTAIDNYFTTLFAEKGVLVDLGELIEGDSTFSLDEYFDAALEEGVWLGKRWVLPYIGSTRVMYFNVDLFEEHGLTRPDELFDAGEWTWETFLESARALTDVSGGAATAVYGCLADTNFYGGLPPWIWGNSGSILNADRTECLLNEPEAVQALEFCQALRFVHEVAPTAQSMQDVNLVAAGRIGVWPSWRGLSMQYREFEYNWEVAPFPNGKEGKLTLYKGNAMGISVSTEHLDQAWEVCKHVTGKEADAIWIQNGGATPRKDNYDVLISSTPPENNHYFYLPLSEGWAKLLPFNPKFREWNNEIAPFLDRIFLDNEDVQQVMDEATDKVNEVLSS